MDRAENRFIRQALEMARQLTLLADEGEASSADDGCAVLYGVIRDCAYSIRKRARHERHVHMELGKWGQNPGSGKRKTARQMELGT